MLGRQQWIWEMGHDTGSKEGSLTETLRHPLREADCQGSPFKMMQAHRTMAPV